MEDNFDEESLYYAEMLYGKHSVQRTLDKPIVQSLIGKPAEDALTAFFDKDINLTKKDLTVLAILGNLDYTDKRFNCEMVKMIANSYMIEWVLSKNRKPFKESFPKSNYDEEDVELVINYIESLTE